MRLKQLFSEDARDMLIELEGLDTAQKALDALGNRAPNAAKTAINKAAREGRRVLIAKAKARYAVNRMGLKHLKELKQTKKATRQSLYALLFIATLRSSLGYFETSPAVPTHFTGERWREGPAVWRARVLRGGPMKELPGTGRKAKAFLQLFESGHVGMVQRVRGSNSPNRRTASGAQRWRNAEGKVEKLQTLGAPGAASMESRAWPEARPEIEQALLAALSDEMERIMTE